MFYRNGLFESGDAEFLYNMIRYFKPRRIFEIGSGQLDASSDKRHSSERAQ